MGWGNLVFGYSITRQDEQGYLLFPTNFAQLKQNPNGSTWSITNIPFIHTKHSG